MRRTEPAPQAIDVTIGSDGCNRKDGLSTVVMARPCEDGPKCTDLVWLTVVKNDTTYELQFSSSRLRCWQGQSLFFPAPIFLIGIQQDRAGTAITQLIPGIS